MLDKRLVEEYRKIKPAAELKDKIAFRLEQEKQRQEKRVQKPLYVRLRPALTGALACVLLVCCLTMLPVDLFGNGDLYVSYAQSGEMIIPSSRGMRAYSDMYCPYDVLPTGETGVEFTLECGARTEVVSENGSIYIRNADGTYEKIGKKARIDGESTLFLEIPKGFESDKLELAIKNRFGNWKLEIELFDGEYKADLFLAE